MKASKEPTLKEKAEAGLKALGKVKKALGKSTKPKKVKSAAVKASVSKKLADGSVQDAESVEYVQVVDPVCTVQMNAGQTVNTGNYSSVKFGVSLSMPCQPKEVESVYQFVKNWVDTKMQELQSEVTGTPVKVVGMDLAKEALAEFSKEKASPF